MEKKIEVIEKIMLFLNIVRFVGRKENEKLVKSQFNNFKYIILF